MIFDGAKENWDEPQPPSRIWPLVAYIAALLLLYAIIGSTAAKACGAERWPVKVGTDGLTGVSMEPQIATVAALAAIKAPSNPDRYRAQRFGPTEQTVYQVDAVLTLIKHEADGDYHMVLTDGADTMIVESPDPACAKGSALLSQIATVRQAINLYFQGPVTGRRVNLAIPVTVTGLGFFDKCHGQEGRAANCIELHPILDIAFGR